MWVSAVYADVIEYICRLQYSMQSASTVECLVTEIPVLNSGK